MKHIPASAIRTAAYPIVFGESADRALAPFRNIDLFGLSLQNASIEEAAAHIVRKAAHGCRTTVNFINAHCVNLAITDREYRSALEESDLLLPDGVGVQIAARLAGCEVPENLNGTDLFPLICERAAIEGAGLFMLGGGPGVADAAAAWACGEWPSLRIRGTQHGYFAKEDEDAVIERINRSGAAILFVGFGVPLQEQWIARNRNRLNIPVVMGVGGLFDYYSGRIARAPAAIRAMRSEWVWRLAMEPRRLGRRYLLGNPLFIAHAFAEAADRRGFAEIMAQAAKRTFDILVATLALLALLPMFLIAALAISAEDRGPVFFSQRRIGKDGRAFAMIKFRSMYTDAEDRRNALLARSDRSGTCFKMKEDPRITRVGKLLRRFSIDELPQLLNVLSGAMSIVGPRPALPSEVARYEGRQWERLHGKPGITCSWQVKGRAEIPFHRQAIMDRAYLRRRSFFRDLKLVFMTLPAIVNGRGAY
ncbi:WecB/TagA/CpsF family glycosyltransferase [Qipengyuania aquimaris]|uniref:WecB/TagA/CpsF family glycosyltransferase n=1 Tax=Qipengyuania aquimaris TaxID=255984 RepID=UPI001FD06A2C|nr:WecB/TagA/CpsF family glycosyltransferase [Qipengyuania aquimaris]UOR15118.1 WecB/TagA/CpsF family glycosyltransferase [Qipengyuania aquimaris]